MSSDKPISDLFETDSKSTSAVKSLVKFLDKIYGAVGECYADSNETAGCMFFQDPSMKDIFHFYPERICLDLTFKHFEIDLSTLTFICEDANGRNYIVAVGFMERNDAESLVWLFNAFKKHNPKWRNIKLLVVDLKITPREVIKDSFPLPLIIVSSYHAIKLFENDVNNMEMNSFQGDNKTAAIDLFKKLILASNQSDFELHFQNFQLFPEPFLSYFSGTWVPTLSEWRIPLDYLHENIFMNLNLFLECYNDAVVCLYVSETSFIEFIKKLFLFISLKKKEKPSLFLQPVPFLYSRFSPEYQICKILTPYAAKFVIEQYDLSSEYFLLSSSASDLYTFDFLGTSATASSRLCSCNFFLFTSLPCRHIFAIRKKQPFYIPEPTQFPFRWNIKYYEHTLTSMQDYLTHNTGCRIPQDFQSRMALSSHLLEVSVQNLLEVPKEVYQDRLNILKKLVKAWEMDDDVSLKFTGIENSKELKDKNESMHSMDIVPCILETINEPSSSSKQDISSPASNISTGEESEQPRVGPLPMRNLRRQGLSDFGSNILNGPHINMAYICCVLCYSKENCVEWMRSKELIPTSMQCPQCNNQMISRIVQRLSDGVVWLCPKTGESIKGCGKRCSVRIGTWFEQINMNLEQLLIFTYMWVNKFSRKQIIGEIGITSSLFVICEKIHRRVCENILKSDDQKSSSPSSRNLLGEWCQKYENEDKFLKFLEDAKHVHNEDHRKCVVVEIGK